MRDLASGGLFKVYAAAALTDFKTDYPGYSAQRRPKLPRQILYTGGTCVVTLDDGATTVTLPAGMAGIPMNIRPQGMTAAGTFADLLVIW